MFDVYKTTQETRVVDRNVTITEKRAPTDESVKLLKWMDFLNDKYHLKAIFKINGEKEEALVRREKQMTELTKYIQENLVQISWGEYGGIKEPSLAQLGALQVLVQLAIKQEMENHVDN